MALLPQSAPAAADWYAADYRETTMTTKGAAAGECSASLDQVPPGEVWAIDRITVSCDSSTPTSALCYDGLSSVPIEGTFSGNFDVADESAPVRLLEGAVFAIVWSGASDGAIGSARVQYTIYRRQSQTG